MTQPIPISNILNIDSLPSEFSFLEGSLSQFLQNVFYSDHETGYSRDNSIVSHSLKIITNEEFGFKIPGIDFKLVLNKGASGGTEFWFNVSIYKGIAKYFENFKHKSFGETLGQLDEILSKIFQGDDVTILLSAVKEFESGTNKIEDGFTTIVTSSSLTLIYDQSKSEYENYSILAQDLFNNTSYSVWNIVTQQYVDQAGLSESEKKGRRALLFGKYLSPNYIFDYSDLKKFLLNEILPKFSISTQLNLGLEIPRKYLTPVKVDGTLETDETKLLTLDLANAVFNYSTSTGLEIVNEVSISFPSQYPKAQIGKTELCVGFSEAKLAKIGDKKGLSISEAIITFPAKWNHDSNSTGVIKAKNVLIGDGGFSGTLSMEAISSGIGSPILKLRLGTDFNLSLDAFSITFRQNAITESIIKGTLNIPGFKLKNEDGSYKAADIDIEAFIENNGDFKISAKPEGGLHMYLENIAKIDINSLALAKENGKFYIEAAGAIDFTELTQQIKGVDSDFPKSIPIKKLRIWEDGKMEFDAGVILLPRAISLNVGPAKVAVTSLTFSSTELFHKDKLGVTKKRKYNVIGFDGSLDVNPGGVSVRGEGVKICFTVDNNLDENSPDYKPLHIFLRVEGIGLEIKVPNDATISEADFYLKGFLAIKSPPNVPENEVQPKKDTYSGEVAFSINQAKISGSATMDYNPNIPSWLVDASVMLSTGIPLGTTGLAIYGFRGLVGKNKKLVKSEEETWWKLYKRPDQGINNKKFVDGKGMTIGLGVALATQSDSGKSFSSILVLIVGLPDVMVMLNGQATFMKERISFIDPDPPFSALLTFDKTSVQSGLGVKYKIPDDTGAILDLNANVEMAYFWKNASAWYINFGKDLPAEERIQARLFSLFDAYAYLMISSSGIKAGAGVSWKFEKSYGPVGVSAGLYLDTYGRISFRPVQLGGGISVGGWAEAHLFKFKIGLSIAAYLEAEAPKPFQIKGGVDVKLNVPKPFKDQEFHLEFAWIFERKLPAEAIGVLGDLSQIPTPANAVNMLTSETFEVKTIENDKSNLTSNDLNSLPIIPLDSFIDIQFVNTPKTELVSSDTIVIQGEVTSPENRVIVPPQKGLSVQDTHVFILEKVQIYSLNGSSWEEYNIFEASEVIKNLPEVLGKPTNYLKTLPQAYWQLITPNKNSHLRIMAQNMFSYLNQAHLGSITTERLGYEGGVVFCEESKIEPRCINWENEDVNTVYTANKSYNKDGMRVIAISKDGTVKNITNSYNLNKGLEFTEVEGVELQFSEAQSIVKPKLLVSGGNILHVEYITKEITGNDHNQLPVYRYESIKTDKLTSSQVASYTGYEDEEVPVFKVRISMYRTTMLNSNHDSVLRIGFHTYTSNMYWYDGCESLLMIDELTIIGKSFEYADAIDIYNNGYSGNNIIAQWNLNGNGNDAVNGHNGTAVNSPYSVPGRNGQNNNAYYVGKSSSSSTPRYFDVPHADDLSIGKNNFTISAWIKIPAIPSWYRDQMRDYWFVGRRNIISKIKNTDGGYNLGIEGWLDHYSKVPKTGVSFQYKVDNSNGGTIYQNFIECNDFMDGNWHHISVIRGFGYLSSIGIETDVLDIYVDGSWLSRQGFVVSNQGQVSDNASIHQVCILDQESHIFNLQIPSYETLEEQNDKMLDGLTKIVQPIWRPNTKYAIEIRGRDDVKNANNLKSYTVAFQTAGATGFFTKPGVPQDADEFLLGRIKGYIDYKNSYPNAEGKLLGTKPLFWKEPSLHLFYNSPYMNLMFEEWNNYNNLPVQQYRLQAQVIDAKALQEEASALIPVWSTVEEKLENQDMTMLNNLLANGPNCWGHPGEMKRLMHKTEYILPNLVPNNMYSVSYFVKNMQGTVDDIEVHKHVFQTSKYKNFEEQINSYSKDYTEVLNGTLLNEDFAAGVGLFAANSVSSLNQSKRLYIESASNPGAEINVNVDSGITYDILFDLVGYSYNRGGDIDITCSIDGEVLTPNTPISNVGYIQNLTYTYTSNISTAVTIKIELTNNNIGKLEYFIIDNFEVRIPLFNNLIVDEDFNSGSIGAFTSSNLSLISVSNNQLRAENIGDPKATIAINVVSGFTYDISFDIMATSNNAGGAIDILCDASGFASNILPLPLGFPAPQPFTLSFVSTITGSLNIDIAFAIPMPSAVTEFIEIDNFEVSESIILPISIITENFDSSAGNFSPSTFSSFTPSKKLYIESQTVPGAGISLNLAAESIYTISFEVVGKSYNGGSNDAVFTAGSISTEILPIAIGSTQTFTFNTTNATTGTFLEIGLVDNNTGVMEYLMIDNVKITYKTTVSGITNALFTLEKTISADSLLKASAIISNSSNQDADLIGKFSIKYDRLLNGALFEIGALQVAIDTEITKIINSSSNKLIGLILRNPEPFFNPSIEGNDLVSSLAVVRHYGTNQTDSNHKLVYSKDISSVFITNDNMELLAGDYHFNFQYLEYNGTAYVLKSPSNQNQVTLTVTI